MWLQRSIDIPPKRRGLYLITAQIEDALPELASCKAGLLHIFIQHTSAGVTINENADSDVPLDLADAMDALAPETFPYRHTCEGPDDMPAHVKAALTGSSVTVPVANGRLSLGTWQGVYLCEFRNRASARRFVLTLHGE